MTKQLQSIPEINASMIASRNEARELTYGANGLVAVDYEDIVLRTRKDGKKFNYRSIFEGLNELADSIDSEGLLEPLKVDILKDGRIVLNDGERRYLGIGILRKRSKELKVTWSKIKCLVNDKDMTDVDRAFQQLNSNNSGQQFDQFDEANAYRELRDGVLGPSLTIVEIALRTTKSPAYVEARLRIADATEEEKELIRSNKVSVTAYSELARQESDPAKRVAKVTDKNKQGRKLKVRDIVHAPGVSLLEESHAILDQVLNEYGIEGEAMNLLLDVQSKLLAIKHIIQ